MRHANDLDLVFFERPQFYDLLQHVQREAAYRPVQMVQTAFGLIRQILTFVSLLALLVEPRLVHRRGGADLAHPGVHLQRALRLAGLPDDALAVAAAAHDVAT